MLFVLNKFQKFFKISCLKKMQKKNLDSTYKTYKETYKYTYNLWKILLKIFSHIPTYTYTYNLQDTHLTFTCSQWILHRLSVHLPVLQSVHIKGDSPYIQRILKGHGPLRTPAFPAGGRVSRALTYTYTYTYMGRSHGLDLLVIVTLRKSQEPM